MGSGGSLGERIRVGEFGEGGDAFPGPDSKSGMRGLTRRMGVGMYGWRSDGICGLERRDGGRCLA